MENARGERVRALARSASITVRLSPEEHEWLRRKAHWEGCAMTDVFRGHLLSLIREDGYLRPPDDEPQDFGFEKEIMEFVNFVNT